MIHLDGSVSLNHGGMEMGQGLHTKMIQIATRVLGIPASKIYFSETATDKVPNATATCGSLSSDLNGMAVIVNKFLLFFNFGMIQGSKKFFTISFCRMLVRF